jgi:hypothetical protein
LLGLSATAASALLDLQLVTLVAEKRCAHDGWPG